MFHSIRLKELLFFLALPVGLGFLSSLLSGNVQLVYEELTLPNFAPPSWVFAPVWLVLYLMVGLASYMVYQSPCNRASVLQALTLYGVMLALNFLWSPLFFQLRLYLVAFWELCALLVLSIVTTVHFYLCSKKTLWLLLPYDLWLLFAAALNRSITMLN